MDLGTSGSFEHRGVLVPTMLYGTAWKEGDTEAPTTGALGAGFPGIDTANQRKHYDETAVGRAVAAWGTAPFLQTKFTYLRGQDARLPYDADAPLAEQVRQCFASSLVHLGVDRIDAYLLHGPESKLGLTPGDWEVWRTMEALHDAGLVRLLGASNVGVDQLRALSAGAKVQPAFVQNRGYARTGFDRDMRAECATRDVVYQGFSLLTANRELWGHKGLHPIARRLGCAPAQVLFRYAMHLGILPLTGTTDPAHMRLDLACTQLLLSEDEQATIAALLGCAGAERRRRRYRPYSSANRRSRYNSSSAPRGVSASGSMARSASRTGSASGAAGGAGVGSGAGAPPKSESCVDSGRGRLFSSCSRSFDARATTGAGSPASRAHWMPKLPGAGPSRTTRKKVILSALSATATCMARARTLLSVSAASSW